ncbi:hypothetical protein C4K01_2604 [Pseudomonas synxantha]|nr:hypothetical protein C4K01_2604 [Pseudomonas synxantha]
MEFQDKSTLEVFIGLATLGRSSAIKPGGVFLSEGCLEGGLGVLFG